MRALNISLWVVVPLVLLEPVVRLWWWHQRRQDEARAARRWSET